jgi:hypothetical protein
MNNPIMRKIVVTASYQSLPAIVGTFEISTVPTNSGVVYFLGDNGTDVPWVAGEYHTFKQISLGKLQVKGIAGDVVTVIGGSW